MWTVTRQHQWPDGDDVVEISSGGIDYCNPDALVAKYPGEMKSYNNPKEAVATAIDIAIAWQKDKPKKTILIAHGGTGGMTIPFEGEPLTEETFAKLRSWAQQWYDSAPKCDFCGELIEESYINFDFPEEKFCSEYCAGEWLNDQEELLDEE